MKSRGLSQKLRKKTEQFIYAFCDCLTFSLLEIVFWLLFSDIGNQHVILIYKSGFNYTIPAKEIEFAKANQHKASIIS